MQSAKISPSPFLLSVRNLLRCWSRLKRSFDEPDLSTHKVPIEENGTSLINVERNRMRLLPKRQISKIAHSSTMLQVWLAAGSW